MSPKRGVLLCGLPALGVALLVSAIVLRKQEPPAVQSVRPRTSKPALPSPDTEHALPVRPAAPVAPKRSPAAVVVAAAEEARIRGTFQNFRTAVAIGNVPLRDSLGKVLRRDQEAAVKLAQEEVAKAGTDRDRDIASRTLEALRR
jgi:hypothetical protein